MLTGVRAFDGPSSVVVMGMQLRETPPPPRTRAGARSIPRALDAVVVRAMKKSPEARFVRADAMQAALEEVLSAPERMRERVRGVTTVALSCAAMVLTAIAAAHWERTHGPEPAVASATLDLAAPIAHGANRYWTILRLATPTVLAMLSQSVVNEVDVVFFSHLPCPESSNGQAALLPSLILVWLFGGSLSAVSVGTQAIVARRFAEGRREAAGAVLTNAVFFCLVAGAIFSALGLLCLPWLVRSMIGVAEVRDVALAYTRWRLLGVLSMAATMAIKAFFDGIGRTHVHLVAAIVMNVANVVLCWAFIFGHLGAPRMGAPGAGLAAFVATWIGLLIMLSFAALARAEDT